jgi:hypothetical protein
MSDQCKNCTVRGDINLCNNTPCSIHESWRDIDIMYQLAAKDQELADSVPRSRVAAMEIEIRNHKDKLAKVQLEAGAYILKVEMQLADSQRVCEKWECIYRLSERIASDRCTELAEARSTTDWIRKLMLAQTEYYLKAENNYDIEISRLKFELEKCKLRWQTGKPPKDGWYWVRYLDTAHVYIKPEHYTSELRGWWDLDVKWSGPIPEPEAEGV